VNEGKKRKTNKRTTSDLKSTLEYVTFLFINFEVIEDEPTKSSKDKGVRHERMVLDKLTSNSFEVGGAVVVPDKDTADNGWDTVSIPEGER